MDKFRTLAKSEEIQYYIDIGCCRAALSYPRSHELISIPVRENVRKAIDDGYPMQNVIALDLQRGILV